MINKYKNFISIFILLVLSLGLTCFATPSLAVSLSEQVTQQLQAGSGEAGDAQTKPLPIQYYIIGIIQMALALVGTIFILMIVLGGYQYFTAAGDEEKSKKGQTYIEQAIIGLLVVLLSYGITIFVGNRVNQAVHNPNFQGGQNAGGYEIEVQTHDIRDVFDNIKHWDWSK